MALRTLGGGSFQDHRRTETLPAQLPWCPTQSCAATPGKRTLTHGAEDQLVVHLLHIYLVGAYYGGAIPK